jgi:signal transduction histidine kinase
MFSPDVIQLIRDVLELFAHASRLPIAMYEIEQNGNIVETVRSVEQLFPSHCHEVWKLKNGEGRRVCDESMCARARAAFDARETQDLICHAGLSNVTEPIIVDGKAVAAIQYGAFIPEDVEPEQRLKYHERAMRHLDVTESEASQIKELLLNTTPRRSREELERARGILTPILKRIISQYVMQREREVFIQHAANHDLQLKLQAVLAHAENLWTEVPNDFPFKEELQDIIGATEAAGTVMHSLARGAYLPKDYRFRGHLIREFIDRAIVLCRAEANKKGIQFVYDLAPQEGRISVQASDAHLQQVFNNVLQNAVKYSYRTTSESRQRFVSIRGRIVRSGYEIAISNYGIGIETDEYEKIFQEGYKGRLTEPEYRTGSGQGLALCQRIMTRHRGTIVPSSEPQGDVQEDGTRPYRTRFTVWLPLRQTDAGA